MTRLSSLQYPVLRSFCEHASEYFSVEDAQVWDQRPFRSMLMRGWVGYVKGKGFHVTKDGRAALTDFTTRDGFRRDSMRNNPLTSYFDPVAYGLHIPQQQKPRKGQSVRQYKAQARRTAAA